MGLLSTIFNFILPQKTDPAAIGDLSSNWQKLDSELAQTPTTVNDTHVTEGTRNIKIDEVPLADNLTSDQAQYTESSFIERTSGGSASIEDGDATLISILGNQVHTGVVTESLEMTVNTVEREEGEPITATIDEDVFKAEVTTSGTTMFYYSDGWSSDPATYGITVTGTPVNGDSISVVYVVGNRGTITVATPTYFNSTGWNLYNNTDGYAKVVLYSEEYGYNIDGEYTALEFATTVTGTRTSLTVVGGAFVVPANGYVFVTGGDATTCIYPTWSDWQGGYTGDFAPYHLDTIDLTSVMNTYFPYGLLRVGDIHDEINFNVQKAISRIQRIAYTDEALETVIESGLSYDADTNYIYVVRETPVENAITLDGIYTVSDHGIEYFTGTTVACGVIILYGNNLKNKLERDVLTISQQTLTGTQQAQIRTNISAASQADVNTLNSKMAKLNVGGSLAGLALNNGKIQFNIPVQGNFSNAATSAETLNNCSLYGSKGSIACTCTISDVGTGNGSVVGFNLTPSVTLSQYTDLAKITLINIPSFVITLS